MQIVQSINVFGLPSLDVWNLYASDWPSDFESAINSTQLDFKATSEPLKSEPCPQITVYKACGWLRIVSTIEGDLHETVL